MAVPPAHSARISGVRFKNGGGALIPDDCDQAPIQHGSPIAVPSSNLYCRDTDNRASAAMALRPRRAWLEQDEERGWRRVEGMAHEIFCPVGVGFNGLRRLRHARHARRGESGAQELWMFCCAEAV
jgi:hypothetical protein